MPITKDDPNPAIIPIALLQKAFSKLQSSGILEPYILNVIEKL